MKRLAGTMLALAVLLAAGGAKAQVQVTPPDTPRTTPLTTPTRDVDVIYRMAGPASEMEQRMRWGVSLGKLRVDPPSPGMFVIIDTATHAVQAVREGDHTVLQLAPGSASPPALPAGGASVRKGEAKVGGLDCTQWQMADTTGRAVLACITPDGVLLRVEADGLILLEAVDVRFAPLPEAVFNVPADYRRIIPPQLSQKPH